LRFYFSLNEGGGCGKNQSLDLSYNQIKDISPLHINTHSEPIKVDFPILLEGTPFANLRLLMPGN